MKIIIIQFKLILILLLFSFKAYPFSSSDYLIAGTAISLNDYITASQYYEESDLLESNMDYLQKKMITLVNANKIQKALKVANKIVKMDINNQEAWMIVLAHAKNNNDLKTFKNFENLSLNYKFNIVNYIFYKNKLLKKNNDNIAQSLLDLVKTSSSNNLNQIKDYNYILFYINLAININETFYEAFFYKAQFFEQLKNYENARNNYIKINSNHFLYLESQIRIAQIEKIIGNKIVGEKILLNLLKVFPRKDKLVISLADYYRSTDQYKKAILHYTTIKKSNNINEYELSRILFMRGICYERINEWSLAEDDFLDALNINPKDSQILNYLAYGWIERGVHIDKSLQMLKTAYEKNPDSHYILDSLAWAYFKKNNFSTAVKLMEKVVNLAPGEVVSLDHLGDIYFSMGRKREAYFMWKQAIDLADPEDEILDKIKIKLKDYNAG